MGFSLASLVAPAAEFVGNMFGGNRDYKRQREIMDTNLHFQEHMSNTAYTRAVADMKNAGLNPMLAYHQGGAQAGGGSTPSAAASRTGEAVSAGVSSALAVRRQHEEIELIRAQKNKVVAETGGAETTSKRLAYEFENLIPTQYQTAKLEMQIKETEALVAKLKQMFFEGVSPGERNRQAPGDKVKRVEAARAMLFKHFEAEYGSLPAKVRNELLESALKELNIEYYVPKLVGKAIQAAAPLIGGYALGKRFVPQVRRRMGH